MANYSIDVQGMTYKKLDKQIRYKYPKVINDSLRSALNKTVTAIRSRATKGIAKASGVSPAKVIRQRIGVFRAKRKKVTAGAYFRYSPLPLEALAGKTGIKWNRRMKGAKVGRKTYRGTFAAVPNKGKRAGRTRIYTRGQSTGDPRSDLAAQMIQLKPHRRILKKAGERVVRQRLERDFLIQLDWRMKKAGLK